MSVKQLNKKLFVSDLDGTLLRIGKDPSKGISEENKLAITKFVDDGNVFAIATARSSKGTNFVSERLGFNVDCVGANGADIRIDNNTTVKTMDPFIINDIIDLMNKYDMDATATYQTESSHFRVDGNKYPNASPREIVISKNNNIHKTNTERIIKINLFVNPLYLYGYFDIFKKQFENICEVTVPDLDMIDFVPLGCTKANGVLKLAEYYGIDAHNIAVVGDSDNDLSMIQAYKYGYCMDTAVEYVKKAAYKSVHAVHEAIEDFTKES